METPEDREGIPAAAPLELRAVAGPTAVSFLLPMRDPATIGRRSASLLQLNDPAVSRDHATFYFRSSEGSHGDLKGEWLLEDLGSTHGTWLNGVRLESNRQYRFQVNDLVVIGPWTLLVVDPHAAPPSGTTMATISDAPILDTLVSRLDPPEEEQLSNENLRLLQQCSERIHGARRERDLVDAVLDAAEAGTTFSGCVFLRPMTEKEQIEVVAHRGDDPTTGATPRLSHTLIREACSGYPVCLQRGAGELLSASHGRPASKVMAVCVPIMVESALAGFIYLDRPTNDPERELAVEVAEAFPLALAHLAALGMANLMRIDIEQRQVRMEARLNAVSEAQQWLSPPRTGRLGPFHYVSETRRGRYVGGDFFDLIPLANDRLAVVLGDVRGRGVELSVLVSATQGFLHGSMLKHEDPSLVVEAVNHFYHARISNARSVRLWVGVFDDCEKTVTYVDADHRYAMSVTQDGDCELFPESENPTVGANPNTCYPARTVPLAPAEGVLLLSHGLIHQRVRKPQIEHDDDSAAPRSAEGPKHFGVAGVRACMEQARPGDDAVAALYAALERHAGTNVFDDDATAIMVRW